MTKPGARWLRTVKPPSTACPSDAERQQHADQREVAPERAAAEREQPGRGGDEADEAGQHPVAELDHGVRLERRRDLAVALRPVRAAEAGAREAHGGAGEDDQRQEDERQLGDLAVLARGEGQAGEAAHAALIVADGVLGLQPRAQGVAAVTAPLPLVTLRSVPRSTEQPAVVVDGLSKHFRMPQERVHTLKERALHPLRIAAFDNFDALDGCLVRGRQGEFFGIVGRNGSGKSTLLKCLAGIYRADRGEIFVDGRLRRSSSSASASTRTSRRATTWSSTRSCSASRRREARERFDSVIEFAELEEFVDLKLKNYSSGMQVRLAFSVMIQVDADILLIDEVLAVGDAAFQQKCFDVFDRLQATRARRSSSSPTTWRRSRFCDRAMLLERGSRREIGEPDESAARYLELNFAPRGRRSASAGGSAGAGPLRRRRRAEILDAWFEDADGEPARTHCQGQRVHVRARVRFNEQVANPIFGVALENLQRHVLLRQRRRWDGGRAPARSRRRRGHVLGSRSRTCCARVATRPRRASPRAAMDRQARTA